MQDLINDSDELGYVISKCLPSIQSINTSYGEIYLDDEARDVVTAALSALFELRYQKLERK